MALYAASMELCGIDHNGFATEDTTVGRFQNSYGIRQGSYVNSFTSTDWLGVPSGLGSFTTFWHRAFIFHGTLLSGRTLFQYINSSATPVFRLQLTSNNVLQAQYWNGSAWTNIGSTYATTASTLCKLDLKIVCGASGSFELYYTTNMAVEGSLVLSGSASMTAVNNIDGIKTYSNNSSLAASLARHSEWIWGDETTVGHRYAWAPPTGDGTDTAGSGSYTDVDEAVTSDADTSTLSANGDAETYTHGTLTAPAGAVKAVQVEARVRNQATGAQNVKARLRVGGTAYNQASNYASIGTSYTGYRARWDTNPATAATWVNATAIGTGIEFGLLAQT
jgi:hypothetical protein